MLLSILTSWIYYTMRSVLFFLGDRKAQQLAMKAQNSVKSHRLSLVSALQEFHRAQCFFSLAIQVASLIAIRTYPFGAKNFGQVLLLFDYVRLVASISMLLLVFTYWYLKGNADRSWYTFLLTLSAFFICLATYTSVPDPQNFVPNIRSLASADAISGCDGGNPKAFCVPESRYASPEDEVTSVYYECTPAFWNKAYANIPGLVIPLVFIGFLIIDHAWNNYQVLKAAFIRKIIQAYIAQRYQKGQSSKWVGTS